MTALTTTPEDTTTDIAPPVTPDRIMQFAWGYTAPLILEAAIKHRVFDVLDGGPKTVDEMSAETGASVRGLRGIMNALVGLGFLAKDGESRYTLTPESETFLVSSKPTFMGGLIRHTSEHLLPNWLQLNEIVRTGQPAIAVNKTSDGEAFFEKFVEDIFPLSYPAARALGDVLGLANAEQPISCWTWRRVRVSGGSLWHNRRRRSMSPR